ncbi:MAG: arsenate reductase ArsC [Proteobacteria bacterium]|nr:arsenate reductase ArsC [Pseudomonadota bacterium]
MTPFRTTLLFLCTGNSARSIIAEAILRHRGGERFVACSAGSHPLGEVNPFALELLASRAIPTEGLRSKSWDEFAGEGAPAMEIVITVCDNAARESCPIWPGAPASAHWGVPDPAIVEGNEAMRRAAFDSAYMALNDRISALLRLPAGEINQQVLKEIGNRS